MRIEHEGFVAIKSVTICKKICNKCGKEFLNNSSFDWDAQIINFNINFNYGSKYDTETWIFDLCENCLENEIKTFKYPIERE